MSTTLYCLAEDSVERERSLQHDIALSHGMDASTCWHLLGSLPPRADDKADLRRIEFTRKGRYHFERRKVEIHILHFVQNSTSRLDEDTELRMRVRLKQNRPSVQNK
ncbi:unnamed protein product [Symbiodinium necroappetens]|uniref:Uncharacterized protein n=2 Tax=Symbiodinium TaxID=2949 RepID=A0A813A614_9DINO|nr:hypothetical protein AK812_SmicGene31212 [Symbiodinium microadriaticum]CAE7550751.1 unnamed protein product [Symbiodinium microadriaticum]CAE7856350.1 unnamed protein product [Symbiodinium necroappetens]CAE7863653.1 unnamed protein product [Symbiodinium sp. KB8]